VTGAFPRLFCSLGKIVIDLTDRIIQPVAPKKPSDVRWHPWRRWLQVLCGVLLVALPLTNGLRADVRSGVLYFGWHEARLSDTMLIFWIGMHGLWALCAVSFLYGRLWCGWVCPQTLASDFAESVKQGVDRVFLAWPGRPQYVVSRSIWTALMLATSIGTGAILACYWLAPSTVGNATARPWTDPTAAFAVYAVAAAIAADLLWIRRKFCSDACPYGAFLGTLADNNTLAVRYLDERDDDCIRCGKCVTDCPMGIDIKKGVGQYACIGCGECVDACNDVLGKRGIPGLIEYRYGLEPERDMRRLSIRQRLGLWDGKRTAVLVALVGFVGAVGWSMLGRLPMTANATADGAVVRTAVDIRNTYTLMVGNGGPEPERFTLSLAGLPQAVVASPIGPITVDGRAQKRLPLTLIAPSSGLSAGSTVPVTLTVASAHEHVVIPLIFYAPK
jgi:polyferredoxin